MSKFAKLLLLVSFSFYFVLSAIYADKRNEALTIAEQVNQLKQKLEKLYSQMSELRADREAQGELPWACAFGTTEYLVRNLREAALVSVFAYNFLMDEIIRLLARHGCLFQTCV